MKKNDRQHGQCAKTVNIWTIIFIVQYDVFLQTKSKHYNCTEGNDFEFSSLIALGAYGLVRYSYKTSPRGSCFCEP